MADVTDMLRRVRNRLLDMLAESDKSLSEGLEAGDLDERDAAIWLCQQGELLGGISVIDDKLKKLEKSGD